METFESSVMRVLDHALVDMYTAMPASVTRVGTGVVDVQPLLHLVDSTGKSYKRPSLLNVPLQMPGSSTSLVHIPVKEEDIVLCVFSMRGLDAFKAGDGTPAAPTDFRMFDKRDAIAIPGIFPFDMHPNLKRVLPFNPDALSLTQDIGLPTESIVELSDAGIALKQGATSVVVSTAGVEITGLLTINGVPFPLHTHTGVTTGGGLSGPVSI